MVCSTEKYCVNPESDAEKGLCGGKKILSVSAGNSHTCGLLENGSVKCWGDNEYGELGDGKTAVPGSDPVYVRGLKNTVREVTAGGMHTCALLETGEIYCWGNNEHGQIGDGTREERPTPVAVKGIEDAVSVSAGDSHTCALLKSGGVKCWGYNTFGQIGDGSTEDRIEPVNVQNLSGSVKNISSGYFHTCAVLSSGSLFCWGFNYAGQLGGGADKEKLPVEVNGLNTEVLSVSAGHNHTCALMKNGGVKCWGANSSGQVGDGTMSERREPTDVTGLSSVVKKISAGGSHTCALLETGDINCWGDNDRGQIGDNSTSNRPKPVRVEWTDSGFIAVEAGGKHTCALLKSGGVVCWGDNSDKQVGDTSSKDREYPVYLKCSE